MRKNFQQLISFYKPYRLLFAADLLCSLLAAGTALAIPLGVRYIAYDLLETGNADPGKLLQVGLALAVLVAVQTLCGYFYDYQGHSLGAKIERDMRAQLFGHCQRLSFSYYDEHTVGEVMSRITNDTNSLAEFFHHVPEDLLINSVKFIGATVILLQVHWQTTLAILAFLPFMVLYTLRFNKKMGRAMHYSRESMSQINAQTEDSLSGIRVVQSFANEEVETRKFMKENEQFLRDRRDVYQSEAKLYCGMDAFGALIPIAVVVVGGLAILNGSLALSDLLLFLLYVGYFTGPVQSLVNTSRLLQEGRTGFHRYRELLDTEPDIKEDPDPVEPQAVSGRIEFQNVSFQYNQGEAVLSDLSLVIEPGEYVAIVGASGIGKTTLCSLLPRFYEPQSGHILLDGIPIEKLSLRSLRKNIGTVQQDVYLFTGTVAENIAYGRPSASREEIIQAAERAGADMFIRKLPQGYETDIGPHGVKLSGGQQQRLSIARAFLKNPPVLILDEATSSLDTQTEQVVQASLEALAQHRTTLVIAHRLSTVQNASRILVMDERGICEEGTHAQLMEKNGVYAKLYQASAAL